MKTFIYCFIAFVFATSCNSTQKTASGTATEQNLSKVSFSIEKTPCFGKCPVYSLTINGATHKATYIGKQNVDKVGSFEMGITDETIKKLMTAFEQAKFNEMKDEYNKPEVTDLPSTYVTYSNDGKTKKVKDRYQAPAELKSLEKLLEDIGNGDGWKEIKGE